NLLFQTLDEFLPRDGRNAGNVLNRFLRIELGALTARTIENVDEMGFEIEQAQFEHGEHADRTCADDDHVGFNGRARIGGAGSHLVHFTVSLRGSTETAILICKKKWRGNGAYAAGGFRSRTCL